MFEVFDPRDGQPVGTFRYRWNARLFVWAVHRRNPGLWLEILPVGEGWLGR